MLPALALAAALLATPQDSTQVQATLASTRISSGTSTVLVITVESSGATPSEIPVPALPAGLELGPISDFSQLQIAFPGGRRRVTRREIVLVGREPGRYTIPGVQLEVSGRRYATSPITLIVVPGSAAAAGSMTGDPAVTLRAWITPDTVFVGEQLLYRAEALFPEALRLRQTRPPVFDPPVTTGLWVFDLPDPVTVGLRVTGDETFEVQSFRQVLFPLSAGDLRIPEARMRYEYRAGSIFTPETRQLVAEPLAVHVRPLPAENRPAGFSGAVGAYTLSAELSTHRTALHDAVTLQVTLEGAGNLKALPRPTLEPVAGLDSYPGAEELETGFADERVSGRKTFEWLLVPRRTGRFTVPAIAFDWFDPADASYHRARTAPLELDVGGPRVADAVDSALAPMRARPAEDRLAFVRSPAFAAAQLLPLLALLALRWRRRTPRPRTTTAAADAEQELRALAGVNDPNECLDRLARLLQQQLANGDPARAAPLRSLHERVRAARYAPVPADAPTCARLVGDARAVLAAARARRSRGAGLVVLLLLGESGVAVAQGQVPPVPAGGGAAELAGFVAAVRDQPRDASAWYDLGNALAARRQTGPAAWAWLHTLQLEPRAADARHNLRVVGAGHALAEVAPLVPISNDELRLLAAALWWAAAGLAAFALGRRTRAPLPWVFGLGVLCAASLVVLAARARPGTEAITFRPAVLRNAPVLRADSIARIAPAEPVHIRELRGEWARVVSQDLREGWLERRVLGRL